MLYFGFLILSSIDSIGVKEKDFYTIAWFQDHNVAKSISILKPKQRLIIGLCWATPSILD